MNATRVVRIQTLLYLLVLVFLPTQFGKHFWPSFSSVLGIRVDYLSPTVYVTDLIIIFLFITTLFTKQITTFLPKTIKNWTILCGVGVFVLVASFLSHPPILALYGCFKLLELSLVAVYTADLVKQSDI